MPGGPSAVGEGIGANAPKVSFAAFGGILFGYDTGVISGIKEMKSWLRQFGYATDDLVNHKTGFAITSSTESLVVSILSAGTFFGALMAAPTADYIGRKWGIVLSCLVFSIGVAMQTASTAIPLFVAGRVFAGLGVGLVSCIIPMYQSECSPKWIRGAVVSTYQWAITIGLLISGVVNNATQNRDDASAYRLPIAMQFIWAAVLAGGMAFAPESPRWLVKGGRDADAVHAMSRLTGLKNTDPELEVELDEIRANLEAEIALGESSYADFNFIFYYGTTFFQGVTIATNIVNVFMTLPGMWGVERFGRRRLLLVGAIGMCVCEFIVAIVAVTISVENIAGQKVLIAIVCAYIAFFASTWGPIAWVITAKSSHYKFVRRPSSNWLWNFGIAYAIPYLVNKAPGSAGLEAKVFFIWGTTCFCCIIFTYFCIPERMCTC
ncbi:hypothetical protein K443DRAFT_130988 [Laccaria amethystina LaAM-08-1]|uniref:Major facilitator superfamily (MFS) profile domain-containing protein n=1 Tax=Laccaria amethystina LaAM-08-1 TaxID=1095629 RepID=A0A0C9Y820_9AGAR|nr:hypothetical protein K443DRAFT_130988 [Laccaria amethystina LaAM-08-1]